MKTFFNKPVWFFFTVLITVMLFAYVFNTANNPQQSPRIDQIAGELTEYITITDIKGNILMQTGLPVHVEDEFINEDDLHYIITSIDGLTATAAIKPQNSAYHTTDPSPAVPAVVANDTEIFRIPESNINVVVYHTHSDESYVPTSGTESQLEGGDILMVGEALREALTKVDMEVTHNTNHHTPHDINAYHRSRKTLVNLLKEGPDAAFDIHRDAAPASTYHTTINGVDTARVMIVVGRSNPRMQTNLGYARRIKAVCDKTHPGLMRGIFIGRGDYNQDLYPSALLFEIGSHNNTLEMAQRGARSLADAIITAFAETEEE